MRFILYNLKKFKTYYLIFTLFFFSISAKNFSIPSNRRPSYPYITGDGFRYLSDFAFDETVFNDDALSVIDFRVESGTEPAMFFIDGSDDEVGIGVDNPESRFHIRRQEVISGNAPNDTNVYIENSSVNYLSLKTHASNLQGIIMGRGGSVIDTAILSTSANQIVFKANGGSTPTTDIFHNVMTLYDGVQVGEPTGGDKGPGTINVSGDIYKNDTVYNDPDYVFEKHYTGGIHQHLDKIGAVGYNGMLSIGELADYTKKHFSLPYKSKGLGLFDGSDWLLARVEELSLYIIQLNDRILELENGSTGSN